MDFLFFVLSLRLGGILSSFFPIFLSKTPFSVEILLKMQSISLIYLIHFTQVLLLHHRMSCQREWVGSHWGQRASWGTFAYSSSLRDGLSWWHTLRWLHECKKDRSVSLCWAPLWECLKCCTERRWSDTDPDGTCGSFRDGNCLNSWWSFPFRFLGKTFLGSSPYTCPTIVCTMQGRFTLNQRHWALKPECWKSFKLDKIENGEF